MIIFQLNETTSTEQLNLSAVGLNVTSVVFNLKKQTDAAQTANSDFMEEHSV